MKKLSLGLSFLVLFAMGGCGPKKSACQYSTDPKAIQLVWTAFKFTEKTPVKGRFNKAEVSGKSSAPTLPELMKGLRIDIDGATVETDNPGRNATIQQFFFEKFNPPFKIQATIASVTGDEQKGSLQIKIDLNGAAKEIPFTYTVTPEGAVEAKGTIDILEFGLQPAFDSLHQACQDLHKGKDGVAKTWTQVDLSLTGNIEKECN